MTRSKILTSLAVVGTVAAVVAIVGMNSSSQSKGTNFMSMGGERLLQNSEDESAFQTFVQKHNRNYLTKEEYGARLGIFAKNLAIIRAHDAVAAGYRIGVNKYADLSLQEFEKMMGLKPDQEGDKSSDPKFLEPEDEDAPEFVDDDTNDDDDDGLGRGL